MTFLETYIILITQETCREKNIFGFYDFLIFMVFVGFIFFYFLFVLKLCTKDIMQFKRMLT